MKIKCKVCGKDVDITKHNKLAPHNVNGVRCPGSGKRVELVIKKSSAVGKSECLIPMTARIVD